MATGVKGDVDALEKRIAENERWISKNGDTLQGFMDESAKRIRDLEKQLKAVEKELAALKKKK